MNSALVEFQDGAKVITSRYAVRKLTANQRVKAAAQPSGDDRSEP